MSEYSAYDRHQTWHANLTNAPTVDRTESHPQLAGRSWNWCGIPVGSPLGISAGPLLNGRWLLHYAALGFDILVYKTVRTRATECYDPPNLVPVTTEALQSPGATVPIASQMSGSWAVSFGMPSVAADDWRRDLEVTRRLLPSGKTLVVSVVGTLDQSPTGEEASLVRLADDFAQCARWAVDSGADGIEANFSCPNVSTADGQLYQQPQAAGFVARTIRDKIGDMPLVLKIGHVESKDECRKLVRQVAPYVSGLAMTNSISAKVSDSQDRLMFDGQARGICGGVIREASLKQVGTFADVVTELKLGLEIVGVGGISNAADVRRYLDAGAATIGIATAAMINPEIALHIRRDWQQ